MKRLLLFALLAAVSVTYAKDQTVTQADKTKFIKDSLSTLDKDKEASQGVSDVRSKEDHWKETQSERDWIEVTDAVYTTAKAGDVKSVVSISSTRGRGATVKYQTLGQRLRHEVPTTAKTPTKARESMYLGMYHIWAERDGTATSDKDSQFDISAKVEEVTLAERRQ